jgi:predicted RNase H-like HicB family nuclease
MKQIKVILELGKDGYGVSFDEIDNIFGFGETVESAKEDAKRVLKFYLDILNKNDKTIPKILQGGYELIYEFDIEALLKYIEGTVTKTALAKASGINASQLSHYSSGMKKPRKEQREKIIAGLHKLGNDLLSVS